MSKADALAFVNEAIDALALAAWRGPSPEQMERVPTIEFSIAEELDRIDRALGPKGESMFAKMAEDVKQAFAALHGAKAALDKLP